MTGHLVVVSAGPRTTVQDLGRFGYAHLGVPPAGPVDRAAAATANAAVGNDSGAGILEITLGGLVLDVTGDVVVAVRGAPAPVLVDGRPHQGHRLSLRPGQRLAVGMAPSGLYVYLAVRGGVDVPPVLGSRSTDTLTGVGPSPVRDGDVLPVGDAVCADAPPAMPGSVQGSIDVTVPIGVTAGPHLDQLPPTTLPAFLERTWSVTPASDHTAARLNGQPLDAGGVTIASEGLIEGCVQLPPDGQPIVFLANHPTTGGYPVIAVVRRDAVARVGQARPGTRLRFSSSGASS